MQEPHTATEPPRLPPQFVQRYSASRLVMGSNAIASLRSELAEAGILRPMVLAGARTRRSDMYARVEQSLEGVAWVDTRPVPAHSNVELVEDLTRQALEAGVDGFVAVGGGSAADTAKAIAIVMAEGGPLARHAVRFTPPSTLVAPALRKPKLPIVSIPGTASGAEVTASLGVRDASGAKLLFSDPAVAARVVLLDPSANLCVPAALMCSTGMNALAHCIEGLYSRERVPLAETYALEALARLAYAVPAVRQRPDDEQARGQLLYAAHLAGLVLVYARTCVHHALCHVIGSVTGAPHGEANAVMLPHCVAFNAAAAAGPLARAAAALGLEDGPQSLVDALCALQVSAGVPMRLRDIGVAEHDLDRIAAKGMGERGLYYNPRQVAGADELRGILEAAY
ncbi:iron-containing alcohol dehydrogenase [Candidimonas humi]|uniref:Iron-containing alcohol dehydrogenase family protein n=1 Tax=Candidimonas humi TaxID=683355 RepID=A0ABV8P2P7_9BURK|nr:iron-containing alcohol dehydrogenase [Candidimonas humi]MBV6306964.1 iron-containing alcohol dehydrogenase [Candidimonas humi]